jgi:hypothetical protein
MFQEYNASLIELCYDVIHARFVQNERIDSIYDGKSPKTKEVRLYRYRNIIHSNFAGKTPQLTCEFSGMHPDVFVVYNILGYDPVSLCILCATF